MRIATWNLEHVKNRARDRLHGVLTETKADFRLEPLYEPVCAQPASDLTDRAGQWVAIWSRFPIKESWLRSLAITPHDGHPRSLGSAALRSG